MVREKTTPIRSLKLSNDKLFDCTRFWSLNGNANIVRSNSVDSLSALKTVKQPEENVGCSHPLSGHPDVPELTELQVLITQAILANEQPCPFDKIFEYVNQRWDGLRRRDGSPYATDCRRAIQANLRITPSHLSLFRKVQYEDSWLICNSLQEAKEYARSKLEKKKSTESRNEKPKRSNEFDGGFQHKARAGKELVEEESRFSGEDEEGEREEEEEEEEELSDAYDDSDGDLFEEEEVHKKEANMTLLQQLIKDSIIRNGGSAKFEEIVRDLSKNSKFKKIQRRNHHSASGYDKRQIIKASLTSTSAAGRLFKKDSRNRDSWVLTKNARVMTDVNATNTNNHDYPHINKGFESDDLSIHHGDTIDYDVKERSVVETPPREDRSISKLESPNTTPKGSRRASAAPSLTDMQAMIIRIISVNGGRCHFKTIISEVSKNWSKLRRRDGTAYSSDSVRAVKASLSNNTYPIPIFKKDAKDPEVWMIADKMFEDMVIKSEKFSSIVSINKRKEVEMQDADEQQNNNSVAASLSPKKRRK